MIYRNRLVTYATVGIICVLGTRAAHAVPIKYTYSAEASGSLGASGFTGPFTITAFADTADVIKFVPNDTIFRVPVSLATVEVSGFPKATFTIPTIAVADNESPGEAGFSAPLQDMAILFAYGPGVPAYDLKSEIGPINGVASYNSSYGHFATDRGTFILEIVTSNVTFRATFVPEPTTATLLMFGMLGCGWRRIRWL